MTEYENTIKKMGGKSRFLSVEEERSLDRYAQAKKERLSGQNADFKTETEKNDFYTLTQPRFGFFAGSGFETFHLRTCKKLEGLTHIKGFSTFKEAMRSGRHPCKYCKPTNKNNIVYSFQ